MMKRRMLWSIIAALLLLQAINATVQGAEDEKIQPDELIARHLASIGTPQALAAARSRALTGTVYFAFRQGGHGQMRGTAVIFSENEDIRVSLDFDSIQYPGDQFAYDGKSVAVGHVKPGLRSPLSRFIFDHGLLLREGLFGGTTTTAWALLNTAERKPKLKYTGLKTVEGRQQLELIYRPRKGAGDVQVLLYFDPGTYRHTASIYKLVRTANMATDILESPYQRDSYYKLLEQFEDFRQVDGLTLPHTYKITLSVEGEPTILQDWDISADEVRHNLPLQPDTFVVR
jgi:hypothetical protein